MSHDRAQEFDAIVVGAGLAGLYMLHRLRGQGLSVRVIEAGNGVGGTWYWNRYPGARCDVESMEYSYQFSEELQQEWDWSERYATQPEILSYIEHVAERFDLARDVQFETRVASADFDEKAGRWTVESDRGVFRSTYIVMATGCLSSPNTPEIPGLDRFAGPTLHTGQWPHEPVDLRGKRVGVIGTGSSAIQSIPHLAEQADQLFVFQRTPNYSIPAHNQPLTDERRAEVRKRYAAFRAENALMPFGFDTRVNDVAALETDPAELEAEYERRWEHGGLPFLSAFNDLIFDREANETAADFLRRKIRAAVDDPEAAALLSPDTVVGCKRLCVDTDYYETFNRPNVRLVDVKSDPIVEITPDGLSTGNETFALDALVLATGFDAMTGAISKIEIRGRGGLALSEKWAAGPRAYLGLQSAGFPNLFLITGPGSPSVLSNMIPSIEQHVNFVADCVAHARSQDSEVIEATAESEDEWIAHVNEVADASLYPQCNSWYLGANVPGKPRVFMPYLGFPAYVEKCRDVVAHGYEGFRFSPLPAVGA